MKIQPIQPITTDFAQKQKEDQNQKYQQQQNKQNKNFQTILNTTIKNIHKYKETSENLLINQQKELAL